MDELKKQLKDAKDYIRELKSDINILELEHIQDITAINHSFGITIEESLKEIDRMDLYDWLTNPETGLNTKLYPLGHALHK